MTVSVTDTPNNAGEHQVVASLADYVNKTLEIRNTWWREDDEDDERTQRQGQDDKERKGQPPPSDFWFRGQKKASDPLAPLLYRPESKLEIEDEDEIRTDFKRRGRQLISEPFVPANDKEWYFLMRHYGAPTRLLDWTDGALLGLYFALRSQNPDTPEDAAVWMLDPNRLNEVMLKRVYGAERSYIEGVLLPEWDETDVWFPIPFEQPLLVNEPIAIDPPHVARRVAVQHSHFTIHGRCRLGLEELFKGDRSRLAKNVVPGAIAQTMLKDLAACGITETTVFPDLEALSRELSWKWRRR